MWRSGRALSPRGLSRLCQVVRSVNALLALLPDFAIIALGALIGGRIPEPSWRRIDWLSYHLLYPALLFSAASSRRIEPESLLLIGLLAAAVVTAGYLLTFRFGRSADQDDATRAGQRQNAWRFNTALGFVAVGALPPTAVGVLAIIVGVAIPLANLYAVLELTRGQALSRRTIIAEVALNPFLLASLAGVVMGLSGRTLPVPMDAFVERLADAAIPVVLLSLGAALRSTSLWPPERHAMALHAIKLFALPAIVWSVTIIGGYQGIVAATLLVFSALPTASAAHVLAARYGADRGRVALVVLQSSAFGLVTLPVWTALAAHMIGA